MAKILRLIPLCFLFFFHFGDKIMNVIIDTINKNIMNHRREQFVDDTHFPESYNILQVYPYLKNGGDVWEELKQYGEIFTAKFDVCYDDYGCIKHFIEINQVFYGCKIQ